MRWCLPLILLTACPVPDGTSEHLLVQTDADGFVLWRGFEHTWTHNHRWNRFGSWVEELPDCPTGRCFGLAHAAASGTSEDVASFEARYSEIVAPGVGFATATAELPVGELFGEPSVWTRAAELRIPLAEHPDAERLRDRGRYEAFLQGFDLYAEEDSRAAKPIDFALDLGQARYEADSDSLVVPWRTYLRMGCSSEECSADETWYDYVVRPSVGVLGFEDEVVVHGPEPVGRTYEWDAPPHALGHGDNPQAPELNLADIGLRLAVDTSAEHAPVFRSLTLHLFHWKEGIEHADQHMVGWTSHVSAAGLDQGDIRLSVGLEFKNWRAGMRRYQAFAYEDVGAATMTADLLVLEFAQASRALGGAWSGSHRWLGEGRSAAGDDAVTHSWEVQP